MMFSWAERKNFVDDPIDGGGGKMISYALLFVRDGLSR